MIGQKFKRRCNSSSVLFNYRLRNMSFFMVFLFIRKDKWLEVYVFEQFLKVIMLKIVVGFISI